MNSDDEIPMDDSDTDDQDELEDQFLNQEDLEIEMLKTISEVQAVVPVETGVCRILLQKFKWNKESLLDRFYENSDTNAFLIDAQVMPEKIEDVPEGEAECDICCDVAELKGLACNHRACKECWKHYLNEKIIEGDSSEIPCMASNCKLIMDDEKIGSLTNDQAIFITYRKRIVASYVEANKFLKWCPGADCGKAVKVTDCEPRLVVCSCGTRFCFSCGNDEHQPVACRHLKLWLKKVAEIKQKNPSGEGYTSDSETFSWVMANTKDCPKCMAPIEKNGGCNYIACRNKSCRYQFCWICMKSWDVHRSAWYNCNAFDPAAEENREKNRAAFLRLLFYYKRYTGHEQSLKLEGKLVKTVNEKMNQMEQLGMSWVEVQFLRKAVDALSTCRHTLMFTYAFAYYLQRDNNSIIFEANQKDLELSTEELSGFLERDMEEENLVSLKQKVQDKCRYVEHRRKILLDHCAEGHEQDTWVFSEES